MHLPDCERCGAGDCVGFADELGEYICDDCWAELLDVPVQCLHCDAAESCELPGSLACEC